MVGWGTVRECEGVGREWRGCIYDVLVHLYVCVVMVGAGVLRRREEG